MNTRLFPTSVNMPTNSDSMQHLQIFPQYGCPFDSTLHKYGWPHNPWMLHFAQDVDLSLSDSAEGLFHS